MEYKHPLGHKLVSLIQDKAWKTDVGLKDIEAHLYDYLNGLVCDLGEEGLPDHMAHEASVTALIDVCAVYFGREKASTVINNRVAEILLQHVLPF